MSPLAKRLAAYLDLTVAERDAIVRLEARERRVGRGEVLAHAGDRADQFYVVRAGWLHSSAARPSGERQIFAFHFPGDLVSLSNAGWVDPAHTLTAVEDCIVSPFPKSQLGALFAQAPRLGGLFYALAAVDYVALCDRLLALGRLDGAGRVASLLLEISSRLRVAQPHFGERFHLPLTQIDIADCVGLTKVHVNRVLRELEERGLIAREGRLVGLSDRDALVEMTGFVDRYAVVATDWLAATAPRPPSLQAAIQ